MTPEWPQHAHANHGRLAPSEVRALCRSGAFDGPTAGVALGYVQVNLVILREGLARDFEAFCRLNPQPCPLLEMTAPGSYEPVSLAPGADLRTDLPRYRVFREGVCIDRPTNILKYWPDVPVGRMPSAGDTGLSRSSREPDFEDAGPCPAYTDLVAFLIGCSFTFESALLAAGLPVRHIEEKVNVPMYRTSIGTVPVGPLFGPLVVSMRPMTPQQAEVAVRITAAVPRVHGAPVHVGEPGAIGIADLARPDYGDAVTIRRGEVPVFWACGVTPMEAIMRARPDFAVVHEPGHMFVTDIPDRMLLGPG